MKWVRVGKNERACVVPSGMIIETERAPYNEDGVWALQLVFVPCDERLATAWVQKNEEE